MKWSEQYYFNFKTNNFFFSSLIQWLANSIFGFLKGWKNPFALILYHKYATLSHIHFKQPVQKRIYCLFAKHDSFRIHVKTHNQRLLHFYGTVNNNNNKNKFTRNVLFGCQIPNGMYLPLSRLSVLKTISKLSKQTVSVLWKWKTFPWNWAVCLRWCLLCWMLRAQSVCLLQICSMQTETGKSVAQYTRTAFSE